jgi:hypothetical protein
MISRALTTSASTDAPVGGTAAFLQERHVAQPVLLSLQVTHQRKPGSIAPGLAEQLVVEFTGQQLRYHYDCIRVQTEVSCGVGAPVATACVPRVHKAFHDI